MRARPTLATVVLAGTTAGAATLVRYHGFALILSGVAVLVIVERRQRRECLKRLALFGGGALLVVGPWLLRNIRATGGATSTGFEVGTGIGSTTKALAGGIGRWMTPDRSPELVTLAGMMAGVLALVVGVVVIVECAKLDSVWPSVRPIVSWIIVSAALVAFVFVTCVIGASDLNTRILAPAFPPFVLSTLWIFGTTQRASGRSSRRTPRLATAVGTASVVALGVSGIGFVWSHGDEGRRIDDAVRHSALVQAVRMLPADVTVVTDDPLAVAYWTSRTPILVVGDGSSDRFNDDTTTASEVHALACDGPVMYARSGMGGALARSFERAAHDWLEFEDSSAISDGELLSVRAKPRAVCQRR
jgi:hypothetical protein